MGLPAISWLPSDEGDRRALYMRLVKAQESVLLRTARRLSGGNAEMAADIVQEAIVSGFVGFMAGKLGSPDGLRPWLLRILLNKAHAEWRHARRSWPVADVTALAEAAQREAGEVGSLGPADEEGRTRALLTAVGELPDKLRAAVELVDLGELEYAEAAAVLGVPVGTVRSRLARARWRLAALLGREEEWR